MSPDVTVSSSTAVDEQNPLLVPQENAANARKGAKSADTGDSVLKVVFERIRRDLSFISRHHPHMNMSGEELSVWAKAIARQLTTGPMVGPDKKDMTH